MDFQFLALVAVLLVLVWAAAGAVRRARRREARLAPDGAQDVTIHVMGSYRPHAFSVRAGRPVRLHFVRDEDSECSDRVFIPDFGVEKWLPAHRATTIELLPVEQGEFLFTCKNGIYIGLMKVRQHSSNRWFGGLDRLARGVGGAVRPGHRPGAAGGPRPGS